VTIVVFPLTEPHVQEKQPQKRGMKISYSLERVVLMCNDRRHIVEFIRTTPVRFE